MEANYIELKVMFSEYTNHCSSVIHIIYFHIAEADHIMQFEQELLDLPCDLPTASEIDLARLQMDEVKKLHPPPANTV